MPRVLKPRWVYLVLWAGLLGVQTTQAEEPSTATPPATPEITRLIGQLGASQFLERQQAMKQLARLGTAALPELRKAAESEDAEIQERALVLLDGIEKIEHERLLTEFIKSPDQPVQLDGWERFCELIPDSTESRSLFAEMHRKERKLLKQWADNERDLENRYLMRCTEVQTSISFRQRRTVDLGTVATLLLIGGEPDINIPTQAIYNVYSFVYSQKTVLQQSNKGTGKVLRPLLGHWIGRPGQDGAYQRMLLAMQHNIPQGTKPAMEMIRNGAINSQMQYAFFAIAKLGTQEHLPFLLKYVNDDRTILKVPAGRGRVQYSIQFRDLALVGLVKLTRQDVRQYFKSVQSNTTYLYNPNSIRFNTDKDRETAFNKWNTWVEKNPDSVPAVPPPPAEKPEEEAAEQTAPAEPPANAP